MFYESLAKESIGFCQHLSDAAVQDFEHLIDLACRDDQRWTESDPVGVEPAQEPVLQRALADPGAEGIGELLFGLGIFDELDALEEPLAANVSDDSVLLGEALEARA